jgi:hypothetical protein
MASTTGTLAEENGLRMCMWTGVPFNRVNERRQRLKIEIRKWKRHDAVIKLRRFLWVISQH